MDEVKVLEQPVVPSVDKVESEYHGIPIDCFRHLRLPLDGISGEEIAHLKDIVAWAKEKSPADYIKAVSKLQSHLGKPNGNERSYDRVWRFIKMEKCINAVRG